MISFVVYGTAVPKGSARAFLPKGWTRPIVTATNNAEMKPWSDSIVIAAREALAGARPLEGPVELMLRFFMPRPKSAPKRVVAPATRPDLDKLTRCVKDALTRAGLYRDDGQVVRAAVEKCFAGGAADPDGERGVPRVLIRARALDVMPTEPVAMDLFEGQREG
jgi:Holliday junction resolvase RusA-like endonuclease